jgi:H+/Cl- antiporter ClcA
VAESLNDPIDQPVSEMEVCDDAAPASVMPKIWMIVLMAVVAILFTIAFLELWQVVNHVVWDNEVVNDNHWLVPVMVIVFSLLVGLCVKYLRAETAIHGSITESVQSGAAEDEYKLFPGTFISAILSLISGASVGPEGALGALVREIVSLFQKRLGITGKGRVGFASAALASAYNGIIGQPLFTAVFATELSPEKKNAYQFIAWNLIGGVIGFLIYSGLGFTAFMGEITFPPLESRSVAYLLYAIVLGLLGALLAAFIGLSFKLLGKLMSRFKDQVMVRILAAAVVIAAVAYFLPELMFSGEQEIHVILADPAAYGITMLLLFGLLKIILLALSFKSGYMGGPIFPILFSCTMLGLALSLALPGVPIILLVMCLEAAAIALVLGAPLSAILLVLIVASTGQDSTYLMALIVISTVTSMLFGLGIKKLMAKRAVKPSEGSTPS